MEYEAYEVLLTKIISLLEKQCEQSQKNDESMIQVFEVSEKRIDRINSMVKDLITTINDLRVEYTTHINKACESRDKVIEQNSHLLNMVDKLQSELSIERERYNNMFSHITDLTKTLAHNNSNTFNM